MRVYHLTSKKNVLSILKNGITLRYRIDPIEIRRKSVYAYPEHALEYVSKFGDPSDVFIEIEVDPTKVYIADLELENTTAYKNTLMKLDTYIREYRRYREPEVLIPFKVTSNMLTGVLLNRKTLRRIYEVELA